MVVSDRPNLVLAQVQVFGPKSLVLSPWTFWTCPGPGPEPELDKKVIQFLVGLNNVYQLMVRREMVRKLLDSQD